MVLWIVKDWSWSQLRWTVTAFSFGTVAIVWIVYTHVYRHLYHPQPTTTLTTTMTTTTSTTTTTTKYRICYSELYKGIIITLWLSGLYAWMMGDLWDLWMTEGIETATNDNERHERRRQQQQPQNETDDDEVDRVSAVAVTDDVGEFLARWILLAAAALFTVYFAVLVPMDAFASDRTISTVRNMGTKGPPCPRFWSAVVSRGGWDRCRRNHHVSCPICRCRDHPRRCCFCYHGHDDVDTDTGAIDDGGLRDRDGIHRDIIATAEGTTIVSYTNDHDDDNNNNNTEDRNDTSEFRTYANLHFYTWVLKDCMWAWDLPLAYFVAFLLTIALNVDLLCRYARHGRVLHERQQRRQRQQQSISSDTAMPSSRIVVVPNDAYIDFWNYVIILLWVIANGSWAFGEMVANAAATRDQFRRYTWPRWHVIRGATFHFRYAAGWVFCAAACGLIAFYARWYVLTVQQQLPPFRVEYDDGVHDDNDNDDSNSNDAAVVVVEEEEEEEEEDGGIRYHPCAIGPAMAEGGGGRGGGDTARGCHHQQHDHQTLHHCDHHHRHHDESHGEITTEAVRLVRAEDVPVIHRNAEIA